MLHRLVCSRQTCQSSFYHEVTEAHGRRRGSFICSTWQSWNVSQLRCSWLLWLQRASLWGHGFCWHSSLISMLCKSLEIQIKVCQETRQHSWRSSLLARDKQWLGHFQRRKITILWSVVLPFPKLVLRPSPSEVWALWLVNWSWLAVLLTLDSKLHRWRRLSHSLHSACIPSPCVLSGTLLFPFHHTEECETKLTPLISSLWSRTVPTQNYEGRFARSEHSLLGDQLMMSSSS